MNPKYIKVKHTKAQEPNPYYHASISNLEPSTVETYRVSIEQFYYSEKEFKDSFSRSYRRDDSETYYAVEQVFPKINVTVEVNIDV
jgi:hypothetical protein